MSIVLTGATGLIGGSWLEHALRHGETVHVLGRHPPARAEAEGLRFYAWDASTGDPPPAEALEGTDAVVHLAGEPIAQRWTAAVKQRLRSTRIQGTRALVAALAGLARPPLVLVSASAVGYYGSAGDVALTEDSPPGTGFLADLCVHWEKEAEAAAAFGVRVVRLRSAMVLAPRGGALQRMLPLFKAGIAGRIGDGWQWMSWIHVDDLVRLIDFVLSEPSITGAVNAAAPNPVSNAEFTRALARAVHRPAFLPVPQLALKLLYGEMASVVLDSQRVLPRRALEAGFEFLFPEPGGALEDVVS